MINYNKGKIENLILQNKIMAVVRDDNYDDLVTRSTAVIDGGVKVMEIPLNSERPYDAVKFLTEKYRDEAVIGAGTVLSAEEGKKAIESGANFLVSPVYVEEVDNLCKEKDILYIAGAMTPTEIFKVKSTGHNLIKFFPAGSLGLKYLKDVKGPFDDVKFIAFAGITYENMTEWLNGGAIAVAIGGALVNPDREKCDYQEIKANAERYVLKIKEM